MFALADDHWPVASVNTESIEGTRWYLEPHLRRHAKQTLPRRFVDVVQSSESVADASARVWRSWTNIRARRRYIRGFDPSASLDVRKSSHPRALVGLHTEPEALPGPSGGAYIDQWLAIERLAQYLPGDWTIWVKDHPYQWSNPAWRSNTSRDRLSLQPRVRLYPPDEAIGADLDSFDLIVTVMGTIGLEAVVRGVPALVFGPAWYSSLKGVWSVQTRWPDLHSIVSAKWTSDETQAGLQLLSRRAGLGDLTHDYWGSPPSQNLFQVDTRDEQENELRVMDSLAHILQQEAQNQGLRPGDRSTGPDSE